MSVLLWTPSAAQGRRLNAPLAASGEHVLGDVTHFHASPDGRKVVYRADQEQDGAFELYAVPTRGGAARKLSSFLIPEGDVPAGNSAFAISPDSRLVAYIADGATDGDEDLYCVPVDGSTAAVRLNGSVDSSDVLPGNFVFTPAGTHLLFRQGLGLYGVVSDGSDYARLLNGYPPSPGLAEFAPSPDGVWAIYRQNDKLYRVPIDASAEPEVFAPAAMFVAAFVVTPAGEVVYVGTNASQKQLWVAAIDGSSAPALIASDSSTLFGLGLSPDGAWISYLRATARRDLYCARVDRSLPPRRLNGALPSGGQAGPAFFTPDSSQVAFLSDQAQLGRFELYTAPSDGSATAVLVSGTLVTGGDVRDVRFAGTRAVYLADALQDELVELFSAPLDGSAAPVRLNRDLFPIGLPSLYPIVFDTWGQYVVYSARQRTFQPEIFGVRASGGGLVPVSPDLAPAAAAGAFELTRDGKVLCLTTRQFPQQGPEPVDHESVTQLYVQELAPAPLPIHR